MEYEIGDIVWVSEAIKNIENENVRNHLFVIIDDDGKVVPMEYFGFVISSNLSKSKENSKFKYNEPLKKDGENNLRSDSIVKCDQLMSIPTENIIKKIGEVNEETINRFLDALNNFLTEIV